MILSKEDQSKYPKFTRWLSRSAPRLKNDPGVVDTYIDLVDIGRQDILHALTWEREPTVKIVEDLQCRRGPAAGCYKKAHPHQIEVEANLVKRYESGAESQTFRTDKGNTVPKVGATVLHELVHWADYKVDGVRTSAPIYHDIGSKWEVIVFGVVSAESLGL